MKDKPAVDFDLKSFTQRAAKVGPKRAVAQLICDLAVLTHKALTGKREDPR